MKPALPLPLSLALLILHLAVGSAGEAPSPQSVQCAAKLAAMSSCLPHVVALPENATLTPSAACCQAFATAIDGAGGGAGCVCDLVRRPFLHGSQLDASRLASLLSSCGKSISVEASSFTEICQDSLAKTETKFETLSPNSTTTIDDYEAESGTEDPDRRGGGGGGGGRRPRPPRPSPSPRRPNPTPSPPRAEPEPPPSPPSPEGPPSPPSPEVACPPMSVVVEIINSADGRPRGMLFLGAGVFLLSIFALC